MKILFSLLLLISNSVWAVELGSEIERVKSIRLAGQTPLIHRVSKTDDGLNPVFYRGQIPAHRSGEIRCYTDSIVAEKIGKQLYTAPDGRSVDTAKWIASGGTPTLDPIFFDTELILRAGTEFERTGTIYNNQGAYHSCIRHHYEKIYDEKGNHIDNQYVCDERNPVPDSYSHTVIWQMKPVLPKPLDVDYTFTCTLESKNPNPLIHREDFEKAFGGEFVLTF